MMWQFTPIFVLHLLRAAWSLIALAVAMGCLLIGSVMARNGRAGSAALFLVFGTALACWFGVALNWFLGLAPLFCISNEAPAMDALAQSVDFVSQKGGRLSLLGLGFSLLRLAWLGTMVLAFFSSLSLVPRLPAGWVLLVMAAIALLYFAGADLLHLARLGAYVSLAEDDAHPIMEPQPGNSPDPVSAPEPGQPAKITPEVEPEGEASENHVVSESGSAAFQRCE
jgi:hypothetical protein